jgi:hypothetical protein
MCLVKATLTVKTTDAHTNKNVDNVSFPAVIQSSTATLPGAYSQLI